MAGNVAPKGKLCAICEKPFVTTWARQKHCASCGQAARDAAGKRGVAARKASQSAALAEIQETLGKQHTSLLDAFERPDYEWVKAFSVPYSLAASKNRRWSLNGKSGVYLSKSVRSYSDMIIAATKAAMRGQTVVQNKLWLSFYVEKENQRSDAVNVVDTLCDAIKVALDLDDRWFCIDRVDWCVKKHDQNIIIKIGQTSLEHAIVCSHCGQIKELSHFTKRASGPFGHSRVCRECDQVLAKHARLARQAKGGMRVLVAPYEEATQ